MSFTSAGAPKSVLCFSAQTADETLGGWIDARGYSNITGYVYGSGTITSGVISFEEASAINTTSPPPASLTTGSYSVVTTCTASDVSGDVQKAYHFPPNAAYGWVRPRISTAIGGGGNTTVTMELS